MNKPKLYASHNGMQRKDAVALITEFVDLMSWGDEERVLDIGCGTGDITRNDLLPALPSFSRLVATDISETMVEYARRLYQHPKLDFQQMDILEPKRCFLTEGYHKVFSFYCLHWISDLSRATSNIFNLLKPGGEALLVFLAKHPLFTIYEKMAEKPQWESYMKDVEKYVPAYQYAVRPSDEFSEVLEEAGFEIIECDCRDKCFEYENVNYLSHCMKAVNPFIDRIPKHLHERYMMDLFLETRKTKGISWKTSAITQYKLMVAYVKKP